MDASEISDIIEIQQLSARYAVGMTQHDVESVLSVFAPGGTYSAFGEVYTTDDFPALMEAAPRGLYTTGMPMLEFDGDTATGAQTLCFVGQTDHEMRLGWYTDTFVRTPDGWRLKTRSMTFLRRSGARDSGKPHDPRRPVPGASRG